jgi:hypothetical protein
MKISLGDGVHVSFDRWQEDFIILTTEDPTGKETNRRILGEAVWQRLLEHVRKSIPTSCCEVHDADTTKRKADRVVPTVAER